MSIAPKDISWVLPGTQYTAADLDRFLQTAASDGGDLSLLEIAWAVAVDEGAGKSYTLADMSVLLFDSSTPLSQYTTYHMLLKDAVYFKQVGRGTRIGDAHMQLCLWSLEGRLSHEVRGSVGLECAHLQWVSLTICEPLLSS